MITCNADSASPKDPPCPGGNGDSHYHAVWACWGRDDYEPTRGLMSVEFASGPRDTTRATARDMISEKARWFWSKQPRKFRKPHRDAYRKLLDDFTRDQDANQIVLPPVGALFAVVECSGDTGLACHWRLQGWLDAQATAFSERAAGGISNWHAESVFELCYAHPWEWSSEKTR